MSDLLVSRTLPVELGPQAPQNSIPVTISSTDDVVLNVKQSEPETEVALSLLGIPRAETTLGVFSDITTYGIDTEIWAPFPEVWSEDEQSRGHGVRFLENRSAGLIEAPPGKFAFLNTKRAFPYLPGRVSSSTFGLRSAFENRTTITSTELAQISARYQALSEKPIRKWGQYSDKNGYYFEIKGIGDNDDFSVVRRTDGIPRSFLESDYSSIGNINNRFIFNNSGIITRAPSGIFVDSLNYLHAVLNDKSMEVPQATPNSVSVAIPGTSNFKYVRQENALVYECRNPRSWFNFDQLNGRSGNQMFYSDVVTINNVTTVPGTPIPGKFDNSVRRIEFDKVTMYKSEYSWYGAIGCIFLTYVPVLEGTARWVKLHYLRGSNQLSFPTLGNPYLPMRFYVQNAPDNTFSEGIEKYGASYYIDGADKGSVRVFSAISESGADVFTGTTPITSANTSVNFNGIFSDFAFPYIRINSPNNNRTFLLESYLTGTVTAVRSGISETVNISPGSIKIKSIKRDRDKLFLFLSKPIFEDFDSTNVTSVTYNNLKAICPRGRMVLGLKMKKTIGPNEIVSKATVFPIRLNTANVGEDPVFFKIIKNSRLPEKTTSAGNSRFGFVRRPATIAGDVREVTMVVSYDGQSPLTYTLDRNTCSVYIRNIPGIFRRIAETTQSGVTTVTGTFTRYEPGDIVTLTPLSAFTTNIDLRNSLETYVTRTTNGWDVLLQESGYVDSSNGRFNNLSGSNVDNFVNSADEYSAILYSSSDFAAPLVNTGQQITTLITGPNNGDDFDLSPYFGFNREFLAGSGLSIDYNFDDELHVVANTFNTTDFNSNRVLTNITWEEQ